MVRGNCNEPELGDMIKPRSGLTLAIEVEKGRLVPRLNVMVETGLDNSSIKLD